MPNSSGSLRSGSNDSGDLPPSYNVAVEHSNDGAARNSASSFGAQQRNSQSASLTTNEPPIPQNFAHHASAESNDPYRTPELARGLIYSLSTAIPVSKESQPSRVGGNEILPSLWAASDVNVELAANKRPSSRPRRLSRIAFMIAIFCFAIAIAIPIGVVVGKRKGHHADSDNGGGGFSTMGGDGSTVTTEDGSSFVYMNKFGGFWVDDPNDPFNNNAQPNSWTPSLNASWTWGKDKIFGVNLGGWFVLQPFITPALFQKYQASSPQPVDEWTLSQAMAADTSSTGGLQPQLEHHYDTFITEQDFAQIAGAGLNWIRVPIPFWAIDVWNNEPFLPRICWKYILRMFRWARKYGLRIYLDFHAVPGSENGDDDSGKIGQINFLMGVMGFANAQRTLGYLRIITEFISQPEYQNLVPILGVLNEPTAIAEPGDPAIGTDQLKHFYLQAYDLIRNITGIGAGNGPFISINDGTLGVQNWTGFLNGSDRVILDTHPYFAFDDPTNDPVGVWSGRACSSLAPDLAASQKGFGVTIDGSVSTGINDCGFFLNGVQGHSLSDNCGFWQDASQWNSTIKDGVRQFALASMDVLQNWFFWTWKVGPESGTNTVASPLWSYQAGLEGGWIPADPRSAAGVCGGDGFDGTYSAWQTGGAGAGSKDPIVRSSFSAWPPTSISGVSGKMSFIPTYTQTGPVSTLPPDTAVLSASRRTASVSEGNGWADARDTAPGVTEVVGCSYPNAWDNSGVVLPTATCTGSAV